MQQQQQQRQQGAAAAVCQQPTALWILLSVKPYRITQRNQNKALNAKTTRRMSFWWKKLESDG